MAAGCLNCLFGHTEVRVAGTRGSVFTGIGALGWRRRFDASQVKEMRILETISSRGQNATNLLIETREGKQVKLGSCSPANAANMSWARCGKTLLR